MNVLEALPVWPAYALTAALLLGIGLGALRLPRRPLVEDAPDQSRWRDIRWWAALLVVLQLIIYAIFR